MLFVAAPQRAHADDAAVATQIKQPFRYIIAPEKVVHIGDEAAAAKSPDYLFAELPQRLATGPVKFHIKAQLAAPGDQTRDPTRSYGVSYARRQVAH